MLIVINFPKIAFLQNFCPADHHGQWVSLEVLCWTHNLKNAIIWKFMTVGTFLHDNNDKMMMVWLHDDDKIDCSVTSYIVDVPSLLYRITWKMSSSTILYQIAAKTLRYFCNRRGGFAKNTAELLKSKEIRANTNAPTRWAPILSHT